jgi:nitroimidazol reductase NimA-like FMN-containing flavoprotein (pyridoxamine 5'-phosphate oxidase superfamily)
MWMDSKGATVLVVPECRRLLAVASKEGWFGRIGIATDQAPIVVPVDFTLHDGRVLARVGRGFSSQAAAGQLVAFQVDHVDEEAGSAWSVLVRGLATLIETPTDLELAVAGRPSVPEPGNMVLAIRPDILTGRRFEFRREHRGVG